MGAAGPVAHAGPAAGAWGARVLHAAGAPRLSRRAGPYPPGLPRLWGRPGRFRRPVRPLALWGGTGPAFSGAPRLSRRAGSSLPGVLRLRGRPDREPEPVRPLALPKAKRGRIDSPRRPRWSPEGAPDARPEPDPH